MVCRNSVFLPFLMITFLGITSCYSETIYPFEPFNRKMLVYSEQHEKDNTKFSDRLFAPDKARHFMGSMMSTVFIYKTAEVHGNMDVKPGKSLATGITISLGILKEIWDGSKPRNHFSWKDLIADGAGIVVGLVIVNQP